MSRSRGKDLVLARFLVFNVRLGISGQDRFTAFHRLYAQGLVFLFRYAGHSRIPSTLCVHDFKAVGAGTLRLCGPKFCMAWRWIVFCLLFLSRYLVLALLLSTVRCPIFSISLIPSFASTALAHLALQVLVTVD